MAGQADDHAIGVQRVLDRVALAEELGVPHQVHLDPLRSVLARQLAQPPGGAHRDGGLACDHGIAGQVPGDLLHGGIHEAHVRGECSGALRVPTPMKCTSPKAPASS